MYPLTIGLAIENRDLMDQAQACLAELPLLSAYLTQIFLRMTSSAHG